MRAVRVKAANLPTGAGFRRNFIYLHAKPQNGINHDGRIINTRTIALIKRYTDKFTVYTDDHPDFPSKYDTSKYPRLHEYSKNLFENPLANPGYMMLDKYAIRLSKITLIQAEPGMFYVWIPDAIEEDSIMVKRKNEPIEYSKIEGLYNCAKKIFYDSKPQYVRIGKYAVSFSKIKYIQAEPDMFYLGIRGRDDYPIAAIRNIDSTLYREIENLYLYLQKN